MMPRLQKEKGSVYLAFAVTRVYVPFEEFPSQVRGGMYVPVFMELPAE